MLDILGDEYISQHVVSKIRDRNREHAYRCYMTDCAYAISNRYKMTKRFSDILAEAEAPEETRTAADIKRDLLNKLNGQEVTEQWTYFL